VGFHEIRDIDTLVNKCRMFDEAGKAKAIFYKAVNEKKGSGNYRGKPYGKDKRKKKDVGGGSKPSGGDVRCYKCGNLGHYANDCNKGEVCLSVARQVTSLLSARVGRLFSSTVEKLSILTPSVLNQRRREERSLH